MSRKEPLANGETYHIYNRSIAEFQIFNHEDEYQRMKETLVYYIPSQTLICFARYRELQQRELLDISRQTKPHPVTSQALVTLLAYCLMPTHFHLILRQEIDDGISIYTANILNSYTRFFNQLRHRKGPLWEGKFKNHRVSSDEQLLHLSRYIHLNPVTAHLTKKAEDWPYSSYSEYIDPEQKQGLCTFRPLISLPPSAYKQFTEDRSDYQRQLASIKRLLPEE